MHPATTRLLEMLEFKRPAFSVYEEAFINRFIRPYKPVQDAFGNLIVNVGANPNIVWSSHTDTVHNHSGLQELKIERGIVTARRSKFSNCLGADCTTGVWIMLEMLDAKIPGRYIFHRDEEAGGHGSKWIAKESPEWLRGISAAIAFDRKGKNDVITSQRGVTASDTFAKSFAEIIGGNYKPSANGMFTDTRNYAALVPECTNISVGYENAHTERELQDLEHAMWLRNQMVQFNSSGLVISRKPVEPYAYQSYTGGAYSQHWRANQQGGSGIKRDPANVFELVRECPTSVSKILEGMGFDFKTLETLVARVQKGAPIDWGVDADQIDSTVTFMQKPKKHKKKKAA